MVNSEVSDQKLSQRGGVRSEAVSKALEESPSLAFEE